MTDVLVLCAVVDNFGDIGFVYRLSRALSACAPHFRLHLVVDDLETFSLLAPGIDPTRIVQNYAGWTVCNWHAAAENIAAIKKNPPRVILECFACGRPAWLEDALFEHGLPHIVHIINIEFVTAEPYAEEFHLLASATRSPRVKKLNFMPGFTPKTGGLIIDTPYRALPPGAAQGGKNLTSRDSLLQKNADVFRILLFSYDRDFSPLIAAIAAFGQRQTTACGTIQVLLAAGAGAPPFLRAWQNAGRPFPVEPLPFLPQETWDAVLLTASFLFVRGEDSLTRACLSGIPFVWHAYPQSDNYQLVKVHALLSRLEPYFAADDFALLSACWHAYNAPLEMDSIPALAEAPPTKTALSVPKMPPAPDEEKLLLSVLQRLELFATGFRAFSASLHKNGDCAAHLRDCIEKLTGA